MPSGQEGLDKFHNLNKGKTMFMQRLITTLILVPLVLLAIFYAPSWILWGVVLVILLLAGMECFKLIPVDNLTVQACFLIFLLMCFWACGYFYSYWLSVGLLVWLLNGLAILTYPRSQNYWGYPIVVAIASLILLPLFTQSLMQISFLQQGKELLVYLLFLIWASDIGAYLTGKQWGKHKLIPKVSPGKSWEGVTGGVILAMIVATLGYYYFIPYSIYIWFGLALSTVVISIFGDLFISILKRRCQLKDTGNIIPGHGGILDRLDSLIAALPWFYFGLTYIPLGI
ncbi:TPA: phosphatidate cytidylyltransferase [Legionella pneumophila]|uniref:Phosphatidate cytidylyltransferase n=4 Tax=Legionella pneumophila TaxID=446 RepID=Q5ZY68_LEGPH|nr:phosphatidate cytidyltransferase [Legionella pneumophila subsp. pneumophila str. Philadelphia 1]AEW50786.1 phosphatidate cytidyltransferase [Legionella pneumophila subsp. pneumophila ATCC 43290]PNL79112.1 phosphatidate cytidylyltransferase [Legionella pneumophila subsp. pneumophila]PPK34873.1 phosphatidate cytidylyltransferase [Legionella pneumophila]OOD04565.1 phosphatidate cytidylyltransferase [Legionella pneumophila subsp. pneumophila ATCC 43290]